VTNQKLKVGILGATGMVGQRFVTLLNGHPWFEVVAVAASPNSAGKKYSEATEGRWKMDSPLPEKVGELVTMAVENDKKKIAGLVDMVFSAIEMDKEDIKRIEEEYAGMGVPVVSNNSAHRWTEDVPMLMPELNQEHAKLIDIQRKRRGWTSGLIAVKPNCSIQSYTSILTALFKYAPKRVFVTSLQAISGAGKRFEDWPEMVDNVIPYIGGEEEKSEKEPMKIWGKVEGDKLIVAEKPEIEATCIRVPVTDGHMASVAVTFENKPTREEILGAIKQFGNPLKDMDLPSSPKGDLITYIEGDDRPQTGKDRDAQNGMGISMGRLREGRQYDWQFVALSHNTLRGAAGGSVLMAELLVKRGYIKPRV